MKKLKSFVLVASAFLLGVGVTHSISPKTAFATDNTAYSYSINSYIPFKTMDINFDGTVDVADIGAIKHYLLNGKIDSQIENVDNTNAEYISKILTNIKLELNNKDILKYVKNITINADKDTDGLYIVETATVTIEFNRNLTEAVDLKNFAVEIEGNNYDDIEVFSELIQNSDTIIYSVIEDTYAVE